MPIAVDGYSDLMKHINTRIIRWYGSIIANIYYLQNLLNWREYFRTFCARVSAQSVAFSQCWKKAWLRVLCGCVWAALNWFVLLEKKSNKQPKATGTNSLQHRHYNLVRPQITNYLIHFFCCFFPCPLQSSETTEVVFQVQVIQLW